MPACRLPGKMGMCYTSEGKERDKEAEWASAHFLFDDEVVACTANR